MVNISLTSPSQGDYSSRAAELARQQKLADMLMQMSQQEIPVSSAGGISAPVSPYSALAKALTSFGGSYLSGKAASEEAALKKQDTEAVQKALQNFYVMPAGSKQPDVGMVDTSGIEGAGPSFAVTGKTNLEDTSTTPQQQMQMASALASGGPNSQALYNTLVPQIMKQQATDIQERRDLAKPKFVAAGASGVVDTNPDSPTYGKVIGAPPPKPEKPDLTEGDKYALSLGLEPGTPEYNAVLKQFIRKETYIASPTAPAAGAPQLYIIGGKPVFTTPQDALSQARKGISVTVAPTVSATQPSEGERKAATLWGRLKFSQDQLNNALTASPEAATPSFWGSAAGSISPVLGNLATPEERQRVEAAQLDILDAALTLGTGAAYTKEQLEGYRKSYFPQYGDKPETIADKQSRLDNVIEQARIAAGRAGQAPQRAPGGTPKRLPGETPAAYLKRTGGG